MAKRRAVEDSQRYHFGVQDGQARQRGDVLAQINREMLIDYRPPRKKRPRRKLDGLSD